MDDSISIPTIRVIYHDNQIIVVSKPAGLRTIRDGYRPEYPYLTAILENDYGKMWVVHRLDKETSGVILFALNPESHRFLNEQFRNRSIKKEYHTIISGNPNWNEIAITSPLRVDGDRKHRTVVNEITGKPARTDCVILERLNEASLLEAKPLTGYTHQIRAHLSSVGFPIIGDTLYKKRGDYAKNSIPHNIPLLLHAHRLSLIHPMTGDPLSFTDTYPDIFSIWLSSLTKNPGK
jgi:tRNA pseudouridine32 synthase/23S rRNA pseudouridine746 synthase